jgi:hypothetical protein
MLNCTLSVSHSLTLPGGQHIQEICVRISSHVTPCRNVRLTPSLSLPCCWLNTACGGRLWRQALPTHQCHPPNDESLLREFLLYCTFREYELITEAHAQLSVIGNSSRASFRLCLGGGETAGGRREVSSSRE